MAVFNILDAYFTLFFLGEGATEANPVADFLLRQGWEVFVVGKSLGIGLCLGFLCLAKNFRMAKVGMLHPDEKYSLNFSAGGGLEYQLVNRHHAFGLAGQWMRIQDFDKMSNVTIRAYLRYTY